jgi:hypothetical protein
VCASLPWGDGVTEPVVWHVVKQYARKLGLAQVAPYDLRRSGAKLCHASDADLDQIQFLPGHVSAQTTERYVGCKQRIGGAVNGHIGSEPEPRRSSIGAVADFASKWIAWIRTRLLIALEPLLISKCGDWIDPGSPVRRNVAGNDADANQQQPNAAYRKRISGGNPIEQTRQ